MSIICASGYEKLAYRRRECAEGVVEMSDEIRNSVPHRNPDINIAEKMMAAGRNPSTAHKCAHLQSSPIVVQMIDELIDDFLGN
jgi:hypothetical protein